MKDKLIKYIESERKELGHKIDSFYDVEPDKLTYCLNAMEVIATQQMLLALQDMVLQDYVDE